jgi:hypothetical protein
MKQILLFTLLFGNAFSICAQIGKVGINTTTPAAMLHVKDSSVLFSGGADITYPQSPPPASGQGIRMMWYPQKAAFRAGYVPGQQWDKDSIGLYSFASGHNVRSSGFASIGMGGDFVRADGNYAVAIGGGTKATGNQSIAIGSYYAEATGFASVVLGIECKSSGSASLAMGNRSKSTGNVSTAFGNETRAAGNYSTATGFNTIAKSQNLFVIGRYNDTTSVAGDSWNLTDPLFIIGNGLGLGLRKNAVTVLKNGKTGINTHLPLAMLHVQDSSVVFTGPASLPGMPGAPPISGAGTRMMWYPNKGVFRVGHVDGNAWSKDSTGIYSIAGGYNVRASGPYSVSFGAQNIASGDFATAMGSNTLASAASSTAIGQQTHAGGVASFASGHNAKAKSYACMALGQFNDTTSTSSVLWNVNDPVFIIGNGTATNARSNAVTVLKNAKTGINTASPDAMLHVVRDVATNGPYNASAAAIFEGDQGGFIQLSNDNAIQSGILSGNEATAIRSALIFAADSSVQIRTGGNTTRFRVEEDGNVGIGTVTPVRLLHIRAGSAGVTPLTSALAVFENSTDASINLITPAANESGIYFGNPGHAAHGGIVYNSNIANGLAFRVNGNATKMAITSAGDVGIGDISPDAKLDVEGTTILGTNGTALNEIIKVTVAKDVASIAGGASLNVDFTVTNSALSSTVYISPETDLASGMIIAYARVHAAGTVRARFTNSSGAAIDLANMNYYITVIR